MARKELFLLVIFLMLPSPALYAEQACIIQADKIVVVFEEPLRFVADEAVNIFPTIKSDLESSLNWTLDFRPTLVLTTNRERFEEMTGSRLVVAYAVPQKNLMVIDYTKMNTTPFSLGTIIKHELCHLLLHNRVNNGRLPKWLDEGISQLASDGIAEIMMSRKASILDKAVLSKKLLSMESLSQSFPRDQESLLLAYEESKSFVEFINHEFGREGVLALLGHLQSGSELDGAVLKSFSIPFDELERRWHTQLRKKINWFTYLANNLYTILFFLAALITIAGFVRMMIRKRRYGEDEYSA
jgi:Peptidase MA superfamily